MRQLHGSAETQVPTVNLPLTIRTPSEIRTDGVGVYSDGYFSSGGH